MLNKEDQNQANYAKKLQIINYRILILGRFICFIKY